MVILINQCWMLVSFRSYITAHLAVGVGQGMDQASLRTHRGSSPTLTHTHASTQPSIWSCCKYLALTRAWLFGLKSDDILFSAHIFPVEHYGYLALFKNWQVHYSHVSHMGQCERVAVNVLLPHIVYSDWLCRQASLVCVKAQQRFLF